jgi:cytochrome c5
MRSFSAWLLALMLLIVSGALGFIFSLYTHRAPLDDNEVQSVQVFHYPALFVRQLRFDPEAGKKIYKEFCVSCHAKNPIIDVKAPHAGAEQDWRRLRGRHDLLKRTIHGVGAMPARGGCFECSDAQIQLAIDYMLKK